MSTLSTKSVVYAVVTSMNFCSLIVRSGASNSYKNVIVLVVVVLFLSTKKYLSKGGRAVLSCGEQYVGQVGNKF